MKPMRVSILLMVAFLLADKSLGQDEQLFFHKYKNEIQEYIMTGHEQGWKDCDILSANTLSHEMVPKISMELDKIKTLNIKITFASSSCLLVYCHVESEETLMTLIDFGWSTFQYVRLALVVKMSSGITLNKITNITKLPFPIAAELEHGKEQFLCPAIGKLKPFLEQEMCNPSYVSYRDKQLRIAFLGLPPQFIFDINSGNIDGVYIKMIRILEQKLNFSTEITVPGSFDDAIAKV